MVRLNNLNDKNSSKGILKDCLNDDLIDQNIKVSNKNTFYVSTAIDYASGAPHIGHAYEKIGADVLARWNRNIGREVFFQTGTDEHGQKIVEKAKEEGKEVKNFVDEKVKGFMDLKEKLFLSNDYFIRTTNENHKIIVQKMLQKAYDNGDIYLGKYEGYYCVGCEKYYPEEDLLEGKICPDHKIECAWIEDENYFFKLSKYQDKLLELYKKNPNFISPKFREMEIINRVNDGLRDISISRKKDKLSWGIEFPFDREHVTYVWFDALFNYYTTTEFLDDKKKFWPTNVHIIGKDIMWFHMVYWPAFLMSCNLDLPYRVHAHGMILDENAQKMSKSLGNVIDPFKEIEKFGLDEFRFFLMSLGSFGEDLKYSNREFIEKINNDLNNDFGNLVSRVHSMCFKYFEGKIPKVDDLKDIDFDFLNKLNFFDKFNENMQNLKFNLAIDDLWFAIRETNAYINKVAPWKEDNKNRLGTIINILCSSCVLYGKYIDCFMPSKSQLVFKQFNIENDNIFKLFFLEEALELNEKVNLFEKIKLEEKKEEKIENFKKKESFSSLCLKIGQIISVKQHPQADKLYIEEIDIGEKKPRQIVSGLKDYYKIEDLENRKVIVVANLKAVKLRGVLSEGMVLVSEDKENKKIGLLSSEEKISSVLESNGMRADNPDLIGIDDFFKVKMFSDGDKIYFENKEIIVNGKSLIIDKNIKGFIC